VRFSKKTEYGLSALIDMCLQQERGGRITTRDIAARRHIPERFLEQQITALRNAGLVNSQRGALGGCSLARRPETITALDVVEALEGPIVDEGGEQVGGAVSELAVKAQQALATVLGSVTLAALARRDDEIDEQGSQMFYV